MKAARLLLILAALGGCWPRPEPIPHRLGVAAPAAVPGQTINYDPTVSPGLAADINVTVYDSGGVFSWLKYDTPNTAWRPVPVSTLVKSDPSQAPGLKAPIGFVVTKIDGTASWIKSTSSDTGWVMNGGGGGIAPDGGTVAPLSGLGSTQSPLAIAAATDSVPGSMSAADKAKLDGIGPTWVASELKTAQALLGSTVTSYQYAYGTDFFASNSNTGTVSYSKGGVQVQTTTTSSKVGLSTYRSATFLPLVPGPANGGKFYISFGAKLVGSADSHSIHILGITDFVGANLEFELLGSISTTIWQAVGTRGGSAFTIAGTGAGATADFSAYHRYAIASTGAAYTFYVDGVSIATSSAISAGPIGDSAWVIETQNTSTAANREIDAEQMFMAWSGDL
jgi:hypothetical protein